MSVYYNRETPLTRWACRLVDAPSNPRGWNLEVFGWSVFLRASLQPFARVCIERRAVKLGFHCTCAMLRPVSGQVVCYTGPTPALRTLSFLNWSPAAGTARESGSLAAIRRTPNAKATIGPFGQSSL